MPGRKEYSEHTAEAIDEEVRMILADAHTRVSETLSARRGLLDTLARLLLEKEMVGRGELDQLLGAADETRHSAVQDPADAVHSNPAP